MSCVPVNREVSPIYSCIKDMPTHHPEKSQIPPQPLTPLEKTSAPASDHKFRPQKDSAMEANCPSSLVLPLALLSCCMLASAALNSSTDQEALLLFKSQLSGNHDALSSWNNKSSMCSWTGITCTRGSPRVQSINLRGLGLSGPISPYISNFSSLINLDLSDNFFYGGMPGELGALSQLRNLTFYNNSLSGFLPSELGLLRKLEVLVVSYNNLSGEVPSSLGKLSSLKHVFLSRNNFSGGIPEEFGKLRNLVTLQLSENNFTGSIPLSIFNISSLQVLSVAQNELVGELPEDMGFTLVNLTNLHLGINGFSGSIPSSISNLRKLESLDLSDNQFNGLIPLLPNAPDLTRLNLANNNLSSTTEHNVLFFGSLTNSTRLQILSLASNILVGDLPNSVANLSADLVEFCIDDNSLSGNFPMGISNFRNLTVLALHENYFTGVIPPTIGVLPKLQRVSLNQNRFWGKIPDMFSNLSQLYQLTLGFNQFTGTIPKSIGDCRRLNLLGLASNKLNGSIPREVFHLTGLIDLRLGQNFLSGSLPIDVGNLINLQNLYLTGNKLSGEIPTTVGDCSSLLSLLLDRNRFRGAIPESLAKLTSLEVLELSSNDLSGNIPKDLGKLQYLRSLNLSFNHLQGEIPSAGIFSNISLNSLQGNRELCSDDMTQKKLLRLNACSTGEKKSSRALKIAIPIGGAALIASFVICFVYAWTMRRKKKSLLPRHSFKGKPLKISYAEIVAATNGFNAENLIGKGGFGQVYKGTLGDQSRNENGNPIVVAIKVLDLNQSKASASFESECEAWRNIRHRNLVKVVTSCSSVDYKGNDFRALIMEFLPRGSLDKWLYPEVQTHPRLCFVQKLKIAIDVASAMDYLHHDCDPPIVHCDLKPSNVLLNDEMTAHVGDFGLARFLPKKPAENQHSTIGLKGSIGYIAPEYGLGGRASTSGDVYSFGILLLETFVARKPTDESFQEDVRRLGSLINGGRVVERLNPALLDDSASSESSSGSNTRESLESSSSSRNESWEARKADCLVSLVSIGLACASHSAKERPTMRETLRKLHGIKQFLLEQRT